MPTRVFLTIDTELMWRHHAAGLDMRALVERSFEPAGVGVGWQLAMLAGHGVKACFFVDPMPALIYGLEPMKRVVGAILDAGQEVQLHLHPNWTGARTDDRKAAASFELASFGLADQRDLIGGAAELLTVAGAPAPVAFRAGSYAASDDTLAALCELGIVYDSSHDGSEHPWPSAISLSPTRIAPVRYRGVIEVPVTVIEDRPGHLRHFQVCALSAWEMRAALDHAARHAHAAVTIVSHSFELANRAGVRANRVHVGRFRALCRMLERRRDAMPTVFFADRPNLPLDRDDRPLGPAFARTGLRRAGQLWSNLVGERGW